jgi:isopentenyl diphosphate isomerase/L-lactate dehydrogenase-like FMN-dependent dehydrogenase
MIDSPTDTARREFLRFLMASPYVAALGGAAAFLERTALAQGSSSASDVIASPADALNVLAFEEAARRKVQPGHWSYMASGVDSDVTLRANREGYSHVQLRPRRLHDQSKVDMKVNLWGTVYNSPIFLCPTGGEKSFHADGELAVARPRPRRAPVPVSLTSVAVEDVNKPWAPVWQQLCAPNSWEANEALLKRVEAAGCTDRSRWTASPVNRNHRARGRGPRVRLP